MGNFLRFLRLENLIEVKHGFAFESEYFSNKGNYILLTPGNFKEEGGFRYLGEKQKYYKGNIPNEYILKKGDVLVAMTEQAPGLLGSTIVVPTDDVFLHNQRLGLVVVKHKNLVLNDYIYHYFNSSNFRKYISSTSTGTKVKHTSPSKIYNADIYLPPIAEQKKIAEILRTWDSAIALTEKLITAKQKRKKNLIKQLIVSKFTSLELRNTGFPNDWYLVTIGQVITRSQYGLSIASENQGKIPIIGMKDLSEGRVLLNDLASVSISQEDINRFCLQRGDILLNRTNSYDLVGKVAIYNSDTPSVFASYIVRFQFDATKVLPEFVNYFLNSSIAQQRLKKLATKGVSQANINPTIFREQFLIPIPPLSEQKNIVNILKTVDIEIELSRKYYYLLKIQKRGLMQKLLTGEWRVKIEETATQLTEVTE